MPRSLARAVLLPLRPTRRSLARRRRRAAALLAVAALATLAWSLTP